MAGLAGVFIVAALVLLGYLNRTDKTDKGN